MNKQDWHVGDIILDKYEVKGILGQGGMGVVYKVYHRTWNTYFAVKSPKPEIFAQTHGKENFMHEAETWVNLGHHPHIVYCDYVEVLGGIPRLFAQYIDGGSLAHWIHRRKLYEDDPEHVLERIIDISIQFAWGLHAAHEQGLVHQDIKPSNVMLTRQGIAKVTDFGLAKARMLAGEQCLEEGEEYQSILVSSRGMTPAYCSPEQAMGQALSRKTDIWSWGVSVFEMFVGKVTWGMGARAPEVLESSERQDSEIPEIPADIANLLRRCFQRQPEMRPATMLEVAIELQAIYAHLIGHPYLREASQLVKISKSALINRAISLKELGKLEDALVICDQVIALEPTDPAGYINRGNIFNNLGRLEEALFAYDQALALDPTNASMYNNKGTVLQELGRRAEALLAYEQAIALNPANAIAFYNKGNVLRELGRREEALLAYDQTIAFNPTHTGALKNKGVVYRELGKQEEALLAYEQAIAIDPTDAAAYFNKGNTLRALGRQEEALTAYEQAITINPTYIGAYNNKGNALLVLGRQEEALLAYEHIIKFNPTHIIAYINKGRVLVALRRREEALLAYDHAIALDPNNAFAYGYKGNALRELGRREGALIAYEQAIALDPTYTDAQHNKDLLLQELKPSAKAKQAKSSKSKNISTAKQKIFAFFLKKSV